jgi:ribonuclease G
VSNELIINKYRDGTRIAFLENKKLVEFHREEKDKQFNVGDIYLGIVKKVVPGLNAAFVDVGHQKDAFLHYHDLGPKFSTLDGFVQYSITRKHASSNLGKVRIKPDINKFGKIAEVLKKGQKIMVQISKEPISTKGPRLSCEISFPGRYVVLVPFSNTVNVSRKIQNREERKRLSRLMESIKPENFGVIVRTVAEDKEVANLDDDLRNIVSNWKKGFEVLKEGKPKSKLVGEMDRASVLLRDVLNDSFDSIIVDNDDLSREIRNYVRKISPVQEKIVKYYDGRAKIFERFGIEKQIKSLFGRSVSISGGGYLVIDHTEALHVVDVNSGNKAISGDNQEETAFKVNLEAAKELARQLRLRDMGGIIVVDFIDMKRAENRKKIFLTMKTELDKDDTKSTALPLSKFGLMQITRQRVRPEHNISTREVCPSCQGSGKIQSTITLTDQIEDKIRFLFQNVNENFLSVAVHPYVHAFFTKGIFSRSFKLKRSLNKKIEFIQDSSLSILDYKFFNKDGDEINLTEEIALKDQNGSE